MMNTVVQQAIAHWHFVAPVLTEPSNESEYDALVDTLNELLDVTGDDEYHPLSGLVDRIGDLVHAYEQRHYPMPKGDGRNALAFLMQQHGLTQSDLSDVASQSVISEILNGNRQLNIHHIKALVQRFGVSADAFL